MNTEKTIVWQASAWAGTEHCKLEPEQNGFVVRSGDQRFRYQDGQSGYVGECT
ncbi:MAG: hypothetical protein ACREGJ_00550 [Candidatus Saccharimonadales bacterium]